MTVCRGRDFVDVVTGIVVSLKTTDSMKKLILFLTALLCLGIQAEAQRPERGKRLSPEEMAEQRTAYMVQKYGLNQEQTNRLFELNKQQMEQMMQQRPPRISRDSLRKMDKEARKAYQKTMKEQGKNLFEKMKEREEAYRKALQEILTAEQFAAFEKDEQARRERREAPRQRRPERPRDFPGEGEDDF